jgi:hypothetical protein
MFHAPVLEHGAFLSLCSLNCKQMACQIPVASQTSHRWNAIADLDRRNPQFWKCRSRIN